MTWQESLENITREMDSPLPPLEAERKLLPLIDIAAWKGTPPARRSLWGDWLPMRQTTMLTGPGGVGKSLLDQMLCTAIALGRSFLGMDTEQRNALYVTCEDDEDELWRRQDAICQAFDVPLSAVIGKLHLCALTGAEETALAVETEGGSISPTDRWRELEATCQRHSIGLYAFDNATDALAADHNSIHHVAAFVNLLTGLAIRQDGVAMILHHPNKQGDDWLGSVAWHNKVRSRLIIEHGDDADPDARILRNPKANYGPTGGAIDFRWHRGAFTRDEDLPADYAAELAQSIKVQRENDVFLTCLRARAAVPGREVGASIGPNYAPARFVEMTEAKGMDKKRLARAMERLFHIGAITTKEVKRDGKGGTKTIIVEAGPNSPELAPEPVPNNSPEHPRTAPEHPRATTTISKDISGAAPEGPPAPDNDGWIGESPSQSAARRGAK